MINTRTSLIVIICLFLQGVIKGQDLNVVIEPHAEEIKNINEQFVEVVNDGQVKYYDIKNDYYYNAYYDKVSFFFNGSAIAQSGNRAFHIDTLGNTLYKNTFDSCKFFTGDLAVAYQDGASLVINKKGKTRLEKAGVHIFYVNEHIYIYRDSGYNYISDHKGNKLHEEIVSVFHYEESNKARLILQKRYLTKVLNSKGEIIADSCGFTRTRGRLLMERYNECKRPEGIYIIDEEGNTIAGPYERLTPLMTDFATYEIEGDDDRTAAKGILDKELNVVAEYDEMERVKSIEFNEDVDSLRILRRNEKSALFGIESGLKTGFDYDFIVYLGKGRYFFRKDNILQLRDERFRIMGEFEADSYSQRSIGNIFITLIKDEKVSYIDYDGEPIPRDFSHFHSPSDNTFPVTNMTEKVVNAEVVETSFEVLDTLIMMKVDKKWTMLHSNGDTIVSVDNDISAMGTFVDGVSAAKRIGERANGKPYQEYGFIDLHGRFISTYPFFTKGFRDGFGMATGKLYTVVNTDLEKVIAPSDSVTKAGIPSDGLIAVQKDGKYGYINYEGELVIGYQYQKASDFISGMATVDNGLVIDKNMNLLHSPENFSEPIMTNNLGVRSANGKWGLMTNVRMQYNSATGTDYYDRNLIPYEYDGVEILNRTFIELKKGGQYAVYSRLNEPQTTWQEGRFEFISPAYLFRNGGDRKIYKLGKFNLIETGYEYVEEINAGEAKKQTIIIVKKDGKYGLVEIQDDNHYY